VSGLAGIGVQLKESYAKPRICIVTTSFPRWMDDDQGTFIVELAKALKSQGAFVRVIAPHAPGARRHEDMLGIDVIRPRYAWPERFEVLRRYRAGLPVILRKTSAAWLLIPLFILTQWLSLLRYSRDVDIIHANWTLSAFSAILVKLIRNIPVVVTVQGSDIYETRRVGWLRLVTGTILSRADEVIALSSSLAAVAQDLGVSKDHIRVMPNGVDVDYFKPSQDKREPLILFVGSIIERKGVSHLIEAAPLIFKVLPEYELVFIGEGPLEDQLQNRCKELELQGKIHFLGVKSPSEVRLWMQKAKLFVLPSIEEGLGVVLLEALACGTPCVASEVDGIPDVITAEVGSLIPPGDPVQLANAIIGILQDPEYWQALHDRSHSYVVENFSWQKISAELIALYQHLGKASGA
jgi:glycosyltransferase involved in cell wall biosynthesis